MKKVDVPQEKNTTLDGVKKVVYATDDKGKYTAVASDGWNAEEIVTSQAVEEFNRLATEAWHHAKDKSSSPLEYHMYNNRMDLPLLSQATGFFKWTIKRDFNISVFNKMSEKRVATYASVLGIEPNALKDIIKDQG